MKNNIKIYMLFAALAGMITTACSNSENVLLPEGKSLQITATCGNEADATRATGSQWNPGDRIGVFSVCSDNTKKCNIPYELNSTTNTFSGLFKFKGSIAGNEIKLSSGATYDFYAYYPFRNNEGDESGSFTIDAADQSTITDYLCASVSGHPGSDPFVSFMFEHAMTKLRIEVSSAELNFNNAIFNIAGVYTQGSVTFSYTSPLAVVKTGNTVTMNISGAYDSRNDIKNGNNVVRRIYEVILPPQNNVTLTITGSNMKDVNNSDACSGNVVSVMSDMNSNSINTIRLTVGRGGKITLNSATIEDWTSGGQTIKVEPK